MTLAGTKGVPRAVREQQIIDVATAEFAERGYANASLVDIAATAGISKPLIYTYFGSRDGLHAACVQRAGEQLVEAVTAAQQVQGAQLRALATLTAIVEALDGGTEKWRVLYDFTPPKPSAAHDRTRHYQQALNALGSQGVAEVLSVRSGPMSSETHSLLLACWFSVVSAVIDWWTEHHDLTAAEVTRHCRQLVEAIQHPR
ncbi:TetR/AcrR family transcriptional regulator [Gordonia terrae]